MKKEDQKRIEQNLQNIQQGKSSDLTPNDMREVAEFVRRDGSSPARQQDNMDRVIQMLCQKEKEKTK